MKRREFVKTTGAAGLIYFIKPSELAQVTVSETALEAGFIHPPSTAYTQTIWMWMNGNVTREGITLDLEAMKKIGVGGVLNFDVGTGIPKGSVEYLGKEWLELKKHAINECNRLGLEFTMHNCPGWSSSGGPWITPELSMQLLTWSEAYVKGGRLVNIALSKPAHRFNHYRDIAVVAFPSLEGEELLQSVQLSSSNEKQPDKKLMTGTDPAGIVVRPVDGKAWLQFEFEQPYEARLLTFFISTQGIGSSQTIPVEFGQSTSIMIQASDDGSSFRDVVRINTGLDTELLISDKFIVFDIPVTKARYFRFTSTDARRYKQVQFSGITRLKNWIEKTNQRSRSFMYVTEPSAIQNINEQQVPQGSIINLDKIVDLTSKTKPDGSLSWNAPAGSWTIIRIGFTPAGTLNRAAPDTGVGLECDKYSAAAISFHFHKMMEQLLPSIKELAAKKKMGLEIDSYESGAQNWTTGFEKQFEKKWKYSIIRYLPILAGGRIINSVDTTERFLWDLRRIQADLIAENYYGQFSKLCHRYGIRTYFEPYESGPFEEMQIGAKADVNLGEFWGGIPSTTPAKTPVIRTPKLISSIAHINNQKIAGAEAFTSEPDSSKWQEYPFAMKALGDKIFTRGINRMVIHRYAHQPHPTALPGMTMGPWGIHFDRTNTWWNQGRAWMDYLSRCQYLLQQGRFVADLVYFTGEDANFYTKAYADELHPVPPEGYDYDVINADAIFKQAKVVNNKLVLKNGMEYRVFVLQNYKLITLPFLRRLKELVQQGMILVGEKPERSAGLSDYKDNDAEFENIVRELWGSRRKAEGFVYEAKSLGTLLQEHKIPPDFEYNSRSGSAPVLYIHRKVGNDDIYFVSNQRRSYEEIVATFRVQKKQPELWDPVTGKITPVALYDLRDNRVRMPLQLEPYGSLFVVFRNKAYGENLVAIEKDNELLLSSSEFTSLPPKLYSKEVQNNFTISFWAKPEINILLQPNFTLGSIVQPWTEYYAIFPPTGKQLYGEGHASCGVTVGRNGIAVWENENGTPILVLAIPVAISGWGHITVAYEDSVPSVYLNGKFLSKGTKSKYAVHQVIDAFYHDGPSLYNGDRSSEYYKQALKEYVSYYNGDMTRPVLHDQVLSGEEIKKLAAGKPSIEACPFVVEITGNKQAALLFKQNGNYALQNKTGRKSTLSISDIGQPLQLAGTWQVLFPKGFGAPESINLPELISLHAHEDEGVKYFSGTASYIKNFTYDKLTASHKRWFLDLGHVEVIAEVKLNGKDLGVLWKRPYQVDITGALENGNNQLEVKITTLWPNRLVGDEQLPEPDDFMPGGGLSGREGLMGGYIKKLPAWYSDNKPKPSNGRVSFTTWKHFNKDSPLLESGLIGPVRVYEAVIKNLGKD